MESLMKTKNIESKKHLFSLIILSYLGSFCNGVILVFVSHAKNARKLSSQKTCFGDTFCDFLPVQRQFSSILGPKTAPRKLLFRCFFENVDFLKIVLPLWWEHSFQGSDPPKISPETDSERQRREKT